MGPYTRSYSCWALRLSGFFWFFLLTTATVARKSNRKTKKKGKKGKENKILQNSKTVHDFCILKRSERTNSRTTPEMFSNLLIGTKRANNFKYN